MASLGRKIWADLAEDLFMLVAGLFLLIWGAIDYEYGIKLGLGLGITAVGVKCLLADIKKLKTSKQG